MEYDFSGWATRNNIKCSDGRTIMKDAFKGNDGQKVPLVWNHQHDDPSEVLGHALLENREEGVYAYCKFNDTESGRNAKALVSNGDIDKLSIYANKLKSQANNVVHGCIREVSLVLAGANPGAFIDSVITHSEDGSEEEEAVIYTDEDIEIADKEPETPETPENPEDNNAEPEDNNAENAEAGESSEEVQHSDDKTIGDIFDTLNEDQQKAVYVLIGAAKEGKELDGEFKSTIKNVMDSLSDEQKDAVYALVGGAVEGDNDSDGEENKDNEGEDSSMKHNVFENDNNTNEELIHSEIVADAIANAKKFGSMKESFIEHAAINNIENIDVLFPDATEIYKEPKMIEEDDSWVSKVMNKVKHTPFSRVKTTFGRMSETEARAKGYIKGSKKTNIKMAFLNRVTTPTTVYIKNEIDRDDVIDITDFDVVAFQKREMRKGLNKELALAMLLGDGRDISDANKINEQNIRPIISDNSMYTIKYEVTQGVDYKNTSNSASDNDSVTKGVIRAAIKARKKYKGSGRPTFYTTEDLLTEMLLIEDQNGRLIYDSIEKLARALRVDEIVTIPEMEAYTDIYGIIVNLADYTAGADKGGSVSMFDDFDIDFNQMKYLMETRMSGALTVPYSAIALYKAGKAPKDEVADDDDKTPSGDEDKTPSGDEEAQG